MTSHREVHGALLSSPLPPSPEPLAMSHEGAWWWAELVTVERWPWQAALLGA